MNHLHRLFLLLLILVSVSGSAQEATIRKSEIFIHKKSVLKFNKISLAEYSIRSSSNEEVINLQFKGLGTSCESDDFMTLYFINEKKIVNSENFDRIVGAGSKNMIKNFINWLFSEKVLNADGTINSHKIDDFAVKYGV